LACYKGEHMPYNIAGKHYDLRPYVDTLGWLVIIRGNDKARFKYSNKNKNQLLWQKMCDHRIDRYALGQMMKQARKLIPILCKEEL